MLSKGPRVPLLKLLIWCLAIGFLLSLFDARPEDIYAWAGETWASIFEWVWEFGQNIGPYALMGAMLVLPVWAVFYLLDWFNSRKRSKP